ncbi:lytic murein transglycosylase [Candidatus Jorgensenbacteria bacterium]|nr:lytic murein transglycosylase [Candidatus Jorgensenbacteria bacterium]
MIAKIIVFLCFLLFYNEFRSFGNTTVLRGNKALIVVGDSSGYQKPLSKKREPSKTPWSKKTPAEKKEILREELKRVLPDNLQYIDSIFVDSRFKYDPSIVTIIKPKKKSCDYFSACFGLLTHESISRGQLFYDRNRAWFDSAYARYGVDASDILGIMRVETNFGEWLGDKLVVNSLFTLYTTTRKKDFAFNELTAFISVCDLNKWNVFEMKGSYMSAWALPQFLWTSYLRFAVDGDKNGIIDLRDESDAILSIANYLKYHGYSKNLKSKQRSILHYNHSSRYVQAVLAYAKAFKKSNKPH